MSQTMHHISDAEFDRCLARPDRALTPDSQRHLAACATCRELYEALCTPAAASAAPEQRVIAALKASLKPVAPLIPARGIAVRLFLLFVAAAAVFINLADKSGWDAMSPLEILGVTAVLLAGALALAFSTAWLMIPGSLRRFSGRNAILFAGVGFVATAALLFPWNAPADFVKHGSPCLIAGLMIALPGAVLFWYLARRGAPVDRVQFGATLGAMAGLLGVAVRQFNCPMPEALHLLVWHGGIFVLAAFAGSLAARRIPATSR